jgi:nucleoside 2-deoxyribosyltransferase
MCGRGKPAFAYSNVTDTYHKRLLAYYAGQVALAHNGQTRGPDGMLIENFDMNENLMLDCGIAAAGGAWVTRDALDTQRYTDTATFEVVLTIAAQQLLGR